MQFLLHSIFAAACFLSCHMGIGKCLPIQACPQILSFCVVMSCVRVLALVVFANGLLALDSRVQLCR
uniref:Secreted protein n=1 Tax=Arundo donax TaxID=35708 RepID=A0A0A9G8S7_ARUDO